ncbi:hypothetical protein ACFOOL_16050 [Devosia honganensis]|uniref:Uncharacterized protein n=1 Tax=Devosia honganensis TaxID=1610527 RepID=A0ABV7X4I9_9HYPH
MIETITPSVLDLTRPALWPAELLDALDEHKALFAAWERGDGSISGQAYDRAIYSVTSALQPYVVKGWHCTRLTEHEISHILAEGLQLPDETMLQSRIDRLVIQGVLTDEIAAQLKAKNQSADWNRAGRLWFVGYQPGLAGRSGIGRFFRHWGGEALYNYHEGNPDTSLVLQRIGIPCIVEAAFPVPSLRPHGLALHIQKVFWAHTSGYSIEGFQFEDCAVEPLPASAIERIHRFPEPEFIRLADCAAWFEPVRL